MKKLMFLVFMLTLVFFTSFVFTQQSSSDEYDNLTKQINDLTSALNMSVKATKPLESQLTSLQSQIDGIKTRVVSIEQDLRTKRENIEEGYKNLAKQEKLLHATIRDYYIK